MYAMTVSSFKLTCSISAGTYSIIYLHIIQYSFDQLSENENSIEKAKAFWRVYTIRKHCKNGA